MFWGIFFKAPTGKENKRTREDSKTRCTKIWNFTEAEGKTAWFPLSPSSDYFINNISYQEVKKPNKTYHSF